MGPTLALPARREGSSRPRRCARRTPGNPVRGAALLFNRHKTQLPTPDQALRGRTEQWFTLAEKHVVLDAPVVTPASEIPEGYQVAVFGLGCFWGAEEIYWKMDGVWST